MATYKPTAGMKAEADRGLEWRREHGRGGTAVGIARARDMKSIKKLKGSNLAKMVSLQMVALLGLYGAVTQDFLGQSVSATD
jgi:hypothetical protein